MWSVSCAQLILIRVVYSPQRENYLISIIRPTTEFHIAVLIIKREPRDVYLACALEDARWHIQTTAVMFDHYICVVRAIESLIRTVSVIINFVNNIETIKCRTLIKFHSAELIFPSSNNRFSFWMTVIELEGI